MAGLQLSGLASGFDWKSLVDNLMSIERAPINRLERDQAVNNSRSNALTDLGSQLTNLTTAANALKEGSLFAGRKATSSAVTGAWIASATAGSPTGSHTVAVSQLATSARRLGAVDVGQSLHTSSDVSGLTMANLRTGTAVSAGTFSINGTKVTVALTDSLQDVFAAINTASGGDVTASYNEVTDKITLTSGTSAEITLGAANDTSNFLAVMKLGNNASGNITSSAALGALKTTAKIVDAGLRAAITAVDGAGDGTFTINGVAINYNVNNDSLSAVLKRINQSGAGVTATYETGSDRVVLTSNKTGDTGVSVSESAGGLLGAIGLTTGSSLARGKNAEFTINGGATLSHTGNTLDASAHGIEGLTVTVTAMETQTINVVADTASMLSKVKSFVTAYNSLQTFIDDKTKVSSVNGKFTSSVLSDNREVQSWTRELRSLARSAVAGVSGTIGRLSDLGIGTSGTSGSLVIADEAKLTRILSDKPTDVESFFQSSTTGFAAKFSSLAARLSTAASGQVTRIGKTNASITTQMADFERQLSQRRDLLTSTFIKMEETQARLQQQSSSLTNAFFKDKSN
ncbi:MAG: flagellar filament capping protein FliD [Candidatus Didemnitutus sp.]|nr:flagellar filament capping protein FliD [Candidatus Didemnitutus sp.]